MTTHGSQTSPLQVHWNLSLKYPSLDYFRIFCDILWADQREVGNVKSVLLISTVLHYGVFPLYKGLLLYVLLFFLF
jgi:hypothetical protein